MTEIIRGLSSLAESGISGVAIVGFGAFLILIKWMMPIIRESSVNSLKLADAIDRKAERDEKLESAIIEVCRKVNDIHDDIVPLQTTVEKHEVRIGKLETSRPHDI